jgi:hypothetical protein
MSLPECQIVFVDARDLKARTHLAKFDANDPDFTGVLAQLRFDGGCKGDDEGGPSLLINLLIPLQTQKMLETHVSPAPLHTIQLSRVTKIKSLWKSTALLLPTHYRARSSVCVCFSPC